MGNVSDEHLMTLQPGTVIAGRYEVVKCLGEGSMGLVYACRHKELPGHKVAVKVLFPQVAQDKVAAARFRNEIFAAYNVSHPNVVRAYEYLRDGDLVAYTMEYVDGGDLAERLEKREPLPVPLSISLLSQMAAGVQAIHDAGIVHRDLKPENILISRDGMVKIADFGIARMGHGRKLTEHGGVVGTIDYVSPEYILNSHVDWRSDIYALGILAYEMLTGTSPFKADSVYATMTKRLKTDPTPPSSLRPDVPAELDRVILTAMARDPEERYQSAAEMYRDLQPLLSERERNSSTFLQPPRPSPQVGLSPSPRSDGATLVAPPSDGAGEGGSLRELGTLTPGGGLAVKSSEPLVVDPSPSSSHAVQRSDSITSPGDAERTLFQPMREERVSPRANAPTADGSTGPKFEPVMRYNDLVTAGGGGPVLQREPRREVVLESRALDQERVRHLRSVSRGHGRDTGLLNVLIYVVAALFGIGVGLVIVKALAPHVWERPAEVQQAEDLLPP